QAESWRADLIVVGSGRRQRMLVGSTAERVARHAPCPVLVVAGPARAPDHILCAVDFSEPSRDALRVATDLAGERGAALTLLHVVSNSERAMADPAAVIADGPDARSLAEETLRKLVVEIQPRFRSEIAVAVAEGRAADGIVEACRSRSA